jgi:uncharacterized protein YciI
VSEPELESLTLVLLKRPPDAPDFPEERLDEIQGQHLAHLREMGDRGAMVAAGPFGDQPDESLRGMCLYRTDVEETRRLAGQDPAVRARRLAVEILTWWFPAGTVKYDASGVRFDRSGVK